LNDLGRASLILGKKYRYWVRLLTSTGTSYRYRERVVRYTELPAPLPMRTLTTVMGSWVTFALMAHCAEIAVDPVTAVAGTTVPVTLRLASAGSRVAALQFDLDFDPVLTLTASSGAVAVGAGKDLYSASIGTRRTRFVIAGGNQVEFRDGPIVNLNASVNPAAGTGSYPLRLTNLVAVDPTGNPVPLTNRDASVTVGLPASNPSTSGIFAQVATGGNWKTTFTLLNLASAQQTAKLTFWNSNGDPMVVPLTFSPELGLPASAGASADVPISPNGVAVVDVELSPLATLLVGWARLKAPDGVVGSATFRFRPSDVQDAEAVVPMETRTPSAFVVPFNNTNDMVTGVAIANGSDTAAANIAILVRDASGRQLLTDALPLPVRGHSFFALTTRYPSLIGLRGSVEFRDANGGTISVLGLRFNPSGSFTSVPAEAR